MNKVWRTAIITAIINFALLLLLFLPSGFTLASTLLVLEFIAGLVLCFTTENKPLGQGLLLGLGLFIVIGGVTCTMIVASA